MDRRAKNILIGTEHNTIEDAIADITSAIPIIGGITDFLRLIDSESRPRKVLQALDMIYTDFKYPGSGPEKEYACI